MTHFKHSFLLLHENVILRQAMGVVSLKAVNYIRVYANKNA